MPRSLASSSVGDVFARSDIPWREREFLTVQAAGEIAGVSPASIYAYAKKGLLTLRKLAGRTLVPTAGLIEVLENAEVWAPSARTESATRAKAARTAASWQD